MKLIKEKKGAALIITLLVITTLTGLVIGFSRESGTELNLSGYSRDSHRAYQAAGTGISFALSLLDRDQDRNVDSLDDEWNRFGEIPFPESLPPEISFTGRIRDESGKLNVNFLRDETGAIGADGESRISILFNALELPEYLVDPLLDWLDGDDIKRLDGAESYYYRNLGIPYDCANSPLLTIRQIFLVKGFNLYSLKNGETGLLDYITIHTDGKININTASREVLQSIGEGLDAESADAIIQYRKMRPFSNPDDLKNVAGINADLYDKIKEFITVNSGAFSIEVEGRCLEAVAQISAVAVREDDGINFTYWRVL
ncbi:type II secretion system minor pseudopilin GspK [Thermodesulfobacteriota bacterium]